SLSVRALNVREQPLELGPVELRDRAVVLLHCPAPEIEVEIGDPDLDRAPKRPAVLRHQPPETAAGDLVPQRLPEVVRNELLELRERQIRLAPHVPELEARIVVARVLVVDQPKLAAD